MSKKRTDTDYLAVSARIRVLETRLLSAERMERMIEAGNLESAAKVLSECGYGELTGLTGNDLERMLTQAQTELFHDLGGDGKIQDILAVFQSKYDYHNAKVLVKGEALGETCDRLFLGGGRYDPDVLAENYRREEMEAYSETFRRGVAHAREALRSTGDPQLADFVLDRAYFDELTGLAKSVGSAFLQGYVALLIDAANLRCVVRASRLNKDGRFLKQVLAEGGNVPAAAVLEARGESLENLFRSGPLAEAAALGTVLSAPGSGVLTDFERLCDNAIMEYLAGGRRIAFGEQPIIGYLYAREADITAVRTIMAGHMAGLDSAAIRQLLRRTYT